VKKLNEYDIKVMAVHVKYPDQADHYTKNAAYCDGPTESYPQVYKEKINIELEQYSKTTERLRQFGILDYLKDPYNSWELIQKISDFGFKVQQKLKEISRWIDVD
jgi:hypothetical protein